MKVHPQGIDQPEGCRLYKSPSTGEYVTDAQYLVEIIVARKAAKDKVTLTYKYWNEPSNPYTEYFKKQIIRASQLLKKYDMRAIMLAIQKIKWCNSLFPKFLATEIAAQQKTLDSQKEIIAAKEPIEINEQKTFGTKRKSKSILGFLQENENTDSIPVEF
jgi:hypothetical protein